MIATNAVHQPRHRFLPFLAIGVAVLGLILTNSVVWWSEAPVPETTPPQGDSEWRENAERPPDPARSSPPWTPKFVGGALVTIPVLCCALYVIVAPSYKDADKKWAYGAVGSLLGFWLGVG